MFPSFKVISILALLTSATVALADQPTFISKRNSVVHAKGFVPSAKNKKFIKNAPRVSFSQASAQIPHAFSLRGKVGPVEDQGQCGSCWDFALTSTLRGSAMSQGKDPGRLSFNYLLNCATEMWGCQGGDFSAADHMLTPQGAPLYGSDGNYTATQGACMAEPVAQSAAKYHMLGKDNPSFQDIAYVVGVLHLPVSIDLAVTDTWEYYADGVYNGCDDEDPADLNHMVTLEGYDCENSVDANGNCVFDADGNLPAGQGLWIIKNSWSSQWGDKGYITMKATDKDGKRCNAVANDALYYDLN